MKASSGGAFRNEHGDWIEGFSRNIGCATILQAELWPIFETSMGIESKDFQEISTALSSYELNFGRSSMVYRSPGSVAFGIWKLKQITSKCSAFSAPRLFQMSRPFLAYRMASLDRDPQPRLKIYQQPPPRLEECTVFTCTPFHFCLSIAKATRCLQILMAIPTHLSLPSSSTLFTPKFYTSSIPPSSFPFFSKPFSKSLNLRLRADVLSSTLTAMEVGEDLPLDYGDWLPSPIRTSAEAGILLHPTSYNPSFKFRVLPLVPPDGEGSPYAGQDANCGSTILISLEELVKDGLLTKKELPQPIDCDRVNYPIVAKLKDPLITKAAERLLSADGELKLSSRLSVEILPYHIDLFIAKQFLFQRQWQNIRSYSKEKGISIMGDMPIYVGYHSADVGQIRNIFCWHGYPLLVSGVPPDAFSETGQLWGSPLYDWKAMEKDGFLWWIRRIRRAQNLYDEFRIDHFRGFAGFWAVPSEAKLATVGRWKVGSVLKNRYLMLSRAVGTINIIAEDLGVITEDVVQLRKYIGAPGMAVLQFGFGSDSRNPHLPHNHEPNQVVYTGTHDNDTIQGWWSNLMEQERSNVLKYLRITEKDEISWALIQAAVASIAQTAVITMQDILGLDGSARMKHPCNTARKLGLEDT
ncbi:4-alpha-glucanotransferase DPE1 [Hibiscus syriacus]|uniref:4-alpha-glucanotransferase n=1 Tax=Hibiscus syriacus TaxID=106335 RepID=A0A6A3BL53_HIBSY|nr:4-alpha-glucanotransferase DPE1 [Hibiscus syriacus]